MQLEVVGRTKGYGMHLVFGESEGCFAFVAAEYTHTELERDTIIKAHVGGTRLYTCYTRSMEKSRGVWAVCIAVIIYIFILKFLIADNPTQK